MQKATIGIIVFVVALCCVAGFLISESTKDAVPTITSIEFSEKDPQTGNVMEYTYFASFEVEWSKTSNRYPINVEGAPQLDVYYKDRYLGKVSSSKEIYRVGGRTVMQYDFSEIYEWHYQYDETYVKLNSTGEKVPLSQIHWEADLSTIPQSWKALMSPDCKVEVV